MVLDWLRAQRNDDCMVAMEWQPEGKRKVDDLNPHGEERWKKNPGKRGGQSERQG